MCRKREHSIVTRTSHQHLLNSSSGPNPNSHKGDFLQADTMFHCIIGIHKHQELLRTVVVYVYYD